MPLVRGDVHVKDAAAPARDLNLVRLAYRPAGLAGGGTVLA